MMIIPILYQRIEDFYFNENHWEGEEMSFEYPNHTSEYIPAFSCYLHPITKKFVINAHY